MPAHRAEPASTAWRMWPMRLPASAPGCCSCPRRRDRLSCTGRPRRWFRPAGRRAWSSGSRRRSAVSSTGWCAGLWPRCCAPRCHRSRCGCCTSMTWCGSWSLALGTDRTGVVDLATPDTTNVITAWRLLRSVDPRLRTHRVRSWAQLIPDMDVAAMQEDWDFEFGWHAIDAVADTGRGLVGRRLDAAGAINQSSGQLALPVEAPPRIESSDGLRDCVPPRPRAWRVSSTTGSIRDSPSSVRPT